MKPTAIKIALLTVICFPFLLTPGHKTESDHRKEDKPIFQIDDIDKRLITANNRFAFGLYEATVKEEEDKNILLSPFSVSLALAMTYNGADLETKEAMVRTLEVQNLSMEEINQSHAALKNVIEHADPDIQLNIANSLWGREGITFHEEFLKKNEAFYDAYLTTMDFNDPKAAATINGWVHDHTNGKIEKMVNDDIHPRTILFLLNAIYFKGEWAEPFDEAYTTERDFYLADGSTQKVPMMSQSGEWKYFQGEGFEAVQLPYGNGRISMNIFLPDENSDLTQFQQQLNEQDWQSWMDHFQSTPGNIRLPRFQVEYDKTLNEALKALGMEVAFDEGRANFERMVASPNENVVIKEVKHRSFIEVNEEGTEAAAATSVEAQLVSAPVPTNTFNMEVNRPFFFTIQDNETEALLFMGSVVEMG
ncbi:serpin family protein [Desmospora activa]|uniref:Serpin B n=1 Tax=Desmospora activa DSM 45169 TaxID=1121389 RepID=A0A2T4Z0H4_9BACL|nr:serpin family protein [Desmospora activa]PTM53220.1 serpin B [Desmospora activa DSM 45169]